MENIITSLVQVSNKIERDIYISIIFCFNFKTYINFKILANVVFLRFLKIFDIFTKKSNILIYKFIIA